MARITSVKCGKHILVLLAQRNVDFTRHYDAIEQYSSLMNVSTNKFRIRFSDGSHASKLIETGSK